MSVPQALVALVVLGVVLTALTLGRGGDGDSASQGTPVADGADPGADRQQADDRAAANAADPGDLDSPADARALPIEDPYVFPDPPAAPDGPVDPDVQAQIDDYLENLAVPDLSVIEAIGASGDPRLLWLLSDIIRLSRDVTTYEVATDAASQLSGLDLRQLGEFSWGPLTDHLIAWDLPAFDDYVAAKARLFTVLEPAWQPFFDDADSDIDWRLVSWGGVLIDDRPLGDDQPCERGCIPSLDDPGLTPAADGGWYPDDAIVFGVRIGGEAIAFPRNIMEVHEMVNMTIGGRQVAIPYCTLCGAAQVFFTDPQGGGTGEIVMRTSGLLHRSNKVMYDLTTMSVFDTFTGQAVSGPLQDQDVHLDQATVVTTTWADWRAAHPDTAIVAEDGGIGRRYDLDPLRGRDDDGPIFPIGDRDGRLGVHDPVLGVVLGDGTTVAFPVQAAQQVLAEGGEVSLAGITVEPDAGGLLAVVDGQQFPSHQAFWFAWSQFHPGTLLWEPA